MPNTPHLSQEHFEEILAIGTALAAEKDLDVLLDRILRKSRAILSADAGSLFLAEGSALRFKLTQNDTVPISLSEFLIPISSASLVGFVAERRTPLQIEDVYQLPANVPYRFNPEVDRATGYRSQSLLCVPMTDHKDRILGVIQLWNKTKGKTVVPFSDQDLRLLASLTAQASIAIENARLYQEIQTLFESFIRASVKAIDARDPSTAGHSERVALLTVALAKEVDQIKKGVYAPVHFSIHQLREIEYAALLHDFGKIGVRESVLLKAKKLYPDEMTAIQNRLEILRISSQLESEKRKVHHLMGGGKLEDAQWKKLEGDLVQRSLEIDRAFSLIQTSNEPTVLKEETSSELHALAKMFPVLEPEQVVRLSIKKGSLSESERLQIESHVTHTYEYLKQIPWTQEFREIPAIAYGHHERLDGTGYPRKIVAADIPLPSKIMAIADIYDALAARDRPYKKAVPLMKALDILRGEAKDKKLDAELLELFVDAKLFELTAER